MSLLALGCAAYFGARQIREVMAVSAAEDQVRDFQTDLNHEVYHGIYERASERLRQGTPEDVYVKYLQSVHEVMGNSTDTQLLSKQVRTTPEGILVTLKYNTRFADGARIEFGHELFVWIVRHSEARLYAYYFDSNRLRRF